MPDEPAPAVEALDLHRNFGGLRAVDGVNLRVPRGALLGLIGPNGAGKTTLFNVIAGALRPTSGRVHLFGKDVSRQAVHRRVQAGLVRTFQITRALGRMTVLENLLLGPPRQPGEHWWAPLVATRRVEEREAEIRRRADEVLAFFELAGLRDEYAGALSGGQKKLLELARALMTEPQVILLDEPMAGVNPTLAHKLLGKIEDLRRDQGLTFVVVEHDLETVFARCDPIVVMANGKIIAQGNAAEIRANEAVVDAYLGG